MNEPYTEFSFQSLKQVTVLQQNEDRSMHKRLIEEVMEDNI